MSKPVYSLTLTTPPAEMPLALDAVKAYLRISHDGDDDFINALIATATQAAESYTGRAFVPRGYSLFLDAFPTTQSRKWWDGVVEGAETGAGLCQLHLPFPPLVSVENIVLHDGQGGTSVYSADNYFADSVAGRIVIKGDASAPAAGRAASGIEIQYTAGYDAIPAIALQALRLLVAYMYEHRGDDMNAALRLSGAANLLAPLRVMEIS